MRNFYVSEEHRSLEMEIIGLAKNIAKKRSMAVRDKLVAKRNKLIKKLHSIEIDGNPVDKRLLSY
jgi:hypothetical protein